MFKGVSLGSGFGRVLLTTKLRLRPRPRAPASRLCSVLGSESIFANTGGLPRDLLRKLHLYVVRPRTALEKIPICPGLLNHFRMQRIPLRESVLPEMVILQYSRHKRLLVEIAGVGCIIGGGAREFVDCEGERQCCD